MGFISAWRNRNRFGRRLSRHFAPNALSSLIVAERKFPVRMRPDLQRALDDLFDHGRKVDHFCGLSVPQFGRETGLSALAATPDVLTPTAPLYEDVDIGEETPVRCLQCALWLGKDQADKFILMMWKGEARYGDDSLHVQIGVAGTEGSGVFERLFNRLDKAVRDSRSYRGKILSLDKPSRFTGEAQGVQVVKLRPVKREEVILPPRTLELLERNVIRFARGRESLRKLGQSCKKGLLLYGPPGTGKTHTIHYLAGALAGHTTLLISGEQVGMLADYMTIARILQPSVVVIEDADLIARERTDMRSVCEEVLLNKLLNEMDGLKEDADILFILSTNRPEALEAALTARPGRIDQAIEFPLPDVQGRRKLIELYARGMPLGEEMVEEIVRRTDGASGAFIKELLRRAVQFHLERVPEGAVNGRLELPDVQEALEEMLFRGGALNVKLLGGAAIGGT